MTKGAEVREALQDHIRSNPESDLHPVLVRAGKPSASAALDVDFDEGSVLLRRDGQKYRLVYAKGDRTDPELAPGEYQFLGYQILRRTESGEPWFISTCGIRKQKINVDEKPTVQKVNPTVHFSVMTKQKKETLNIQLVIKSDLGSAITIYKNESRVPASFELRDADGDLVADGPMQYG